MGRIVTTKYRCEVRTNGTYMTPSCWKGRATEKRLTEYVISLNQSFLPNGVNQHVSKARGFVVQIIEATIIEQSTGMIVAQWKAPVFQEI